MSQYIKVLKNFTCYAITAEDPNGQTRKSFTYGEKLYSLKRVMHANGKTLNIVCPDFLLLDVPATAVYPLVDAR